MPGELTICSCLVKRKCSKIMITNKPLKVWHFGVTLKTKNCIYEEITGRLYLRNDCYN